MKRTLYDKVWDNHLIKTEGDLSLIYVDMHYIHEVTSPQAFDGIRASGRSIRRVDKTFATMDHNTPTTEKEREFIADELSRMQLDTLRKNCKDFKIPLLDMNSDENGIVHLIGPELGHTQPNRVIVCGDSHTATHGAFGAIAFGIGTSDVEHVFATQTVWQKKLKNLGVKITGKLRKGVYAKDIILAFLKEHGVSVGTGYAVEFYGDTIKSMDMESRMTICNMAIEGGSKVGMIAPDEVTFEYLKDKKFAPKGEDFDKKVQEWKELYTDDESCFDKIIEMDVSNLKPQITWGTNPAMTVNVNESFPEIKDFNDEKAYDYMGLEPNQNSSDINVTHIFIGSCTNGRYSDLLEVAKYIGDKKVKKNIKAVIVPGSMRVKLLAEKTGLAQKFIDAGFEWRLPGCSSCLGMNPDLIAPYAHCISTSNRNFEGRQGQNARTHLVSPAMAGACAVHGRVVDISEEGFEI